NEFLVACMCYEHSNGCGQQGNSCISPESTGRVVAAELPTRGTLFTTNVGEKSIASPWDRFYVAWALAAVAQNRSQAIYQDIEAMFELHVAVRPQVIFNFFTRNQLARTIGKQAEEIERLAGESDRLTSPAEPPQAFVQFELSQLLQHGGRLSGKEIIFVMRKLEVGMRIFELTE